MNRKIRLGMVAITFLMVLALSAMWTVPARADDATPQPPAVPAVSQGTSDAPAAQDAPAKAPVVETQPKDPAPTEAPAVATQPKDPAPTEAPAVATQPKDPAPTEAPAAATQPTDPAPTEAPTVGTQPTDAAPTEAPVIASPTAAPAPTEAATTQTGTDAPASPADLSQVPTGTDVKVLDATGAVVPLASTEAAQIVATGDPMWCPTGVAPGGLGCTTSKTSFNGLNGLIALLSGKTAAGTIWIQSNYDSTLEGGSAVTLDGVSLGSTANYALTLKGGWTGTSAGTINSSTPSTFNVPLSILNWNASVTLSDIIITGVTGAGSTALTITTKTTTPTITKNITLTRVNVHDNAGTGADLDNSGSPGTVTVTSSTFNKNTRVLATHLPPYQFEYDPISGTGGPPYTGGLVVHSKGVITLNSVIANGNGEAGALLYNNIAGATAGVTVTGTNIFNTNGYTGLIAFSNGVITANNITANSSVNGAGVFLENDFTPALTPINVTLTGASLNSNFQNGLVINSKGAITINSVTASNNHGEGAGLDNSTAVTVQAVTLAGTNIFNQNDGNGLTVTTKSAINYSNLTANGNGLNGANLKNTYAPALTPMGVTISNSTFNSNGAQNKPGTIQMGLLVYSNGTITLTNINANYNGSAFGDPADGGVYLENITGTAGISMTGTNFISDNATGLTIKTNGAVSLYNLVNNGNSAGYGAYIDNCTSVIGAKCTHSNVAPVSILGISEFKFNAGGLHITTNGLITLNKITATYNQGTCDECGGVYLYNKNSSTLAGVTLTALTGTNNFSNNGMTGLQVYTKGLVTLNNITANNNGWYEIGADKYHGNGALIDNSTGVTSPKAVSLLGTNIFNNNVTDGLVVYSKGAITASNLSASYNGWTDPADLVPTNSQRGNSEGAHLDNCIYASGCTTVPATAFITLSGVNTFNGNAWGTGLNVQTPGVITVSNLTANNNGNSPLPPNNKGSGATLENDWLLSTNPQPTYSGITVSGYGIASNNGNRGMGIYSTGAVILSKQTANGNGGEGVHIANAFAPSTPKNVSLTDISNTFNSNGDTGLYILSYGVVTLNNLTANSNGQYDATQDLYIGHGVYVDNSGSTLALPPLVSITGVNTFKDNKRSGLEVLSKGAISTNSLTAMNNGWFDSVHDITGTPLYDTVYGYGVRLVNTSGLAPVSLTGTNYFDSNWNSGLDVETRGSITVYNLTSNSNGQENGVFNNAAPLGSNNAHGAYLNNRSGATGNITILGYSNTRANYESGLEINTQGIVSLINLAANDNGFRGVFIDNAFSAAAPRNVTISGTNTFNNNTNNAGLTIYSYGTIALNNLSANTNGGAYNAFIDNCRDDGTYCAATTMSPVTLTGNNSFDGNWNSSGNGLIVKSFGSITINNLSASTNTGQGATLKNQWQNQVLAHTSSTGVITLTGYAKFNSNGNLGLEAWSNGVISIANLNANGNHTKGAYIDNDVSAAAPKNVTIGGTNTFNNNLDTGLEIYSYGTIALINISANANGGTYNAIIDNCRYDATGCTATTMSPVTLTGNNSFDHNSTGAGLNVQSFGNITINNLSASNNNGLGAILQNQWQNKATIPVQSTGTLTLTGYASFNGNGKHGLEAWSNGVITIANLNANSNGGNSVNGYSVGGAYLDANKPGSGVSNVVLTGLNNFNQNLFGQGLTILADGAITISNLTASQNQNQDATGAYLDNKAYGSVTFPQVITLTGNNNFLSNSVDGLRVYSYGAITIYNLTANNNVSNVGYGAYLNNQWGKQSNITLTGPSSFDNNGGNGLGLYTNGLVSLSNIDASGNGLGGALINADGLISAANVTIGGSNFFQNNQGGDGLNIITDGVITLNNITANLNSGNGASLDNHTYGFVALLPAIRLNITGTNVFNGNGSNGLQFNTYGNASTTGITNITADNNGVDGVSGTVTNGNIVLACGSMNHNGGHGYNLSALTAGKTITLSGVNGYSNTIPGNVATALTPIIRNRACPYP